MRRGHPLNGTKGSEERDREARRSTLSVGRG
jgi:hypothetical protein